MMVSKLKKIFEVNFFFSNILVPSIALLLYCGSFAYLSSRFFLVGVNNDFTGGFGNYVLLITIVASLLFFVILKLGKGSGLRFQYFAEKFYVDDLLLLLLPLTPVVQYVLSNRAMLFATDILYVLVLFSLFSCFYIFFVPALVGTFMPNRTLMALGLAFVFTIANMASVSAQFSWFERGALGIQAMFFSATFFASWTLYKLNSRWLLYSFIVLNFVINSSTQLLSQTTVVHDPPLSFEKNKLLFRVENKTPAITPNIYLLLYDAYVPNETMLAYGINNSSQEDYLTAQGFKLYPHTYSIGSETLESMTKVLNASAEYYDEQSRKGASGDGVTQKILKSLGYKTLGLFPSDYMFRGYGNSYDYSFPEKTIPPYVQLLKLIFLGEFRFDVENVGIKDYTRDQFIEAKRSVFERGGGNRVFVYMHTNLPSHSQNSGACLSNEVALYEEKLKKANVEMKQDVDLIIKNDPDAILIVAGDHGPYLTKNCIWTTGVYDIEEISRLDIQDRYGTFLAIRWPTGDFVEYDDIVVLQDLFPSVFSYLYKDTSILKAKIKPIIPRPNSISGASVDDGIILGGINNGEPLFLSDQ